MCNYSRDVAIISKHGLASEAGLLDVIEFVFTTIQQPLSTVPMIRADIRANGLQSRFLFSTKRTGLAYARDNVSSLLAEILNVIEEHGTQSPRAALEAVDVFFQVPGLGVVKAGFVAQCLGFNVACIDSHNLERLGIPNTAVDVRKTLKRETQRIKISKYVELCQREGSATYWNDWCDYVAGGQFNKELPTGDAVSAFHVHCVIDCGDDVADVF